MGEEDVPSTQEFLAIAYQCKLTNADLEEMTYGDVIDYIDAYIEMNDPEKEKVRNATQDDINAFFG